LSTQIQKYKLTELDGGGRVVSEKLPAVRSISLGFWLGSGSRHERPGESGISHFIEHLLFKGSDRFPATEIAELFDSIGADINAATAREYTVVHARFLDEHLEEAFEVMADMVLRPAFREVDQEREVVVEEIAMYEDSPSELIADYLTSAIFGDHPLGKSVLGTAEIIGAVSAGQLRRYHSDHYTLPNLVIAGAGNIEQEELASLAAVHLEGANGDPAAAQTAAPAEPPAGGSGGAAFYQKDTQQYHVCFGGLGLPRGSQDKYAVSILDSILGSTASSRLFQEVREKRGLVYSIYSYASFYSDSGLVGVYFGCRGDSVEEVTGIVSGQLRSLMDDGISGEELRRAKESAKGKIVLGMETSQSRMSRLGKLTVTGSEILTLDEIIEKVNAVTAADVQQVAQRLYDPDKLSAVAIGPDIDVFERAVRRLSGAQDTEIRVA